MRWGKGPQLPDRGGEAAGQGEASTGDGVDTGHRRIGPKLVLAIIAVDVILVVGVLLFVFMR